MKNNKVRNLIALSMLAALAYVVMVFIRVPVVMFLKYEPKDVIITIAGFIYGPLASFIISLVVSLVEMVTVSETGPIGAVMNLISTCAFSCTAAFIYKKIHRLKGAIIGLIAGALAMIAVMMLWNYFLTPLYMGTPREAVAAMLPTVFLPFNALKGGLNAAITMLLYKPVVLTLRRAHLAPETTGEPKTREQKTGHTIGVIAAAAAVVITCVIFILIMNGVF